MAVTGTLLFSHVLPVLLAFFGILFLISGIMDNNKYKLGLGLFLFVFAAISPFIFLRFIFL
ncbi:hypothetical protein BGI41_05500 [Methanobrevibacter sp. 87.7]|uniref:hypothetical protein n=1 Tax=Methanobrevibacter sp. 87.7 TaxID=387957 RepID=UPI000B5081DE|nr:hypothetical protein [Methanobrevibacter sp. 87.7]OWT32843.1 hypothetical protein BGI41_05500 [Methanobrevibacter sp. 87.7]